MTFEDLGDSRLSKLAGPGAANFPAAFLVSVWPWLQLLQTSRLRRQVAFGINPGNRTDLAIFVQLNSPWLPSEHHRRLAYCDPFPREPHKSLPDASKAPRPLSRRKRLSTNQFRRGHLWDTTSLTTVATLTSLLRMLPKFLNLWPAFSCS